MKLTKFEKIEQIKVGTRLSIKNKTDKYSIEIHRVLEITDINEAHTNYNDSFFNLNMALRGDSWAKDVHIIEEING
jgi:hypothetical protein